MRLFDLLSLSCLLLSEFLIEILANPDFGSPKSNRLVPLVEAVPPLRRKTAHAEREMKLIRYLVRPSRYDRRARPVGGQSIPVNITLRMNLYQIVDVVERSQYVVLYTWMTQLWYDELLSWNPKEFGNITSIVLPYTDVWLPDTYLYNNLQMARESSERWIRVIVEMDPAKDPNRAFVTFRYPAIYQFTCHMNVKYFPFDKQKCSLIFGSWTYDATGIDFFAEKREVAKEDFTESEEWALISFRARKVYEKYACCPHPFALLFYDLVIQRRPLHYIINLIIPTLIISIISNIGFFMPSSTSGERNEKISLGITTLLAMSILLLMVSDSMPTTSSTVPLIGWFLIGIMAQTSFATAATAIILVIHLKGRLGRPVPTATRRIFFSCLNKVLRVTPPQADETEVSDAKAISKNRSSNGEISNNTDDGDFSGGENEIHDPYFTVQPDETRKPKSAPIKSQSCSCCRGRNQKRKSPTILGPKQEWEWLASILDRMALIISILAIIGIAFGCGLIGFLSPQKV